MKKVGLVLFCFIVSLVSYSQSIWTIGIDGGLDYHLNKYHNEAAPHNAVAFKDGGLDFHAGIDLGMKITKVVKFRVNCNYGEYSFGQKPTGGEPYAKAEKTLSYIGIIPRVDVLLASFGKFDLLVSPGLDLEYIIGFKNKTTGLDGEISDSDHSDHVRSNYKSNYKGVAGEAILRYNITKNYAITLSPEYTYFLNELYEKNTKNMQRFRVGLGFQWTI